MPRADVAGRACLSEDRQILDAPVVPMDQLTIGAVVDLTGIPAHTLRKWETRHNLVVPVRTDSGRRVYTQAQVEALRLVRTLHGLGHSLASLAGCSLQQLQELDRQHTGKAQAAGVASVHIVGPALCAAFQKHAPAGVDVTFDASDANDWLGRAVACDAEALVLEMPALDLQRAHRIGDLASTYQGTLLVAYAFASRQTLRALRLRNVLALTLPVQPDVVFALLANMQHFLPSSDAVGEMRFSDGQLARIAALSPSIQCECPNHIARLLLEISAFERYCAQCEDTDPGERALHEHLGRVTARARGLFEEALVAVAEADGLDLR